MVTLSNHFKVTAVSRVEEVFDYLLIFFSIHVEAIVRLKGPALEPEGQLNNMKRFHV